MGLRLDEPTKEALDALCRKYAVKQLKLFGSAAREDFDPEKSDIDLAATFGTPPTGIGLADQFFRFKEDLEALFGRQVDLLEEPAIENSYILRAVRESSVVLYAA